jgi:hypothetical protein
MSTRSQRFSGTVMTETPCAASASDFDGSLERAVTTTDGGTEAAGNTWSRRATPRVTCK